MKFRIAALLLSAMLLVGCGTTMPQSDTTQGTTRQMLPTGAAAESTSATITKEQAQAIALEHAGFSADQVTNLRTEFEIDDGVPRFEVQFRQGRWEYDYEINAGTGAILSYDKDIND